MKTIKISRARFIEELAIMSENYGSSEWAIYASNDGCVQARHVNYLNAEGIEYHKVLPMSSLNAITDNSWEVAERIVDECAWDQHENKEIYFEMV